MKFLIIALGLTAMQPAFGLNGTAKVFEQGSGLKKELFTWKRTETGDAKTALQVKQVYSNLDGTPAVIEEVTLQKGRIKQYAIEYKQTGESGSMEVHEGKIHFSYTREGKTKTDEEDEPKNLVVTGTVADYVAEHLSEIEKGETIEARLGVLDRKETVNFKFFKDSEGTRDGRAFIKVKMKPTSFIINAIVDPLFFTYWKETARLAEIDGRTMPKRRDGEKWKDLDADVVYSFPAK